MRKSHWDNVQAEEREQRPRKRTKLAMFEIQKGQCGQMAAKKEFGRRCSQRKLEHVRSCRPTSRVNFIFIAMGSHWTLSEEGKYVSDASFILLHIS